METESSSDKEDVHDKGNLEEHNKFLEKGNSRTAMNGLKFDVHIDIHVYDDVVDANELDN